MNRPSLALTVAINHAVREPDEWFNEPDDLDRVQRALDTVTKIEDPIHAAAILAARITRAQGFGEANKRTAFLVAKWTLDHNGVDGERLIPPGDRHFADLLVKASMGRDVELEIVRVFRGRALELGIEPRPAHPTRSIGREPPGR